MSKVSNILSEYLQKVVSDIKSNTEGTPANSVKYTIKDGILYDAKQLLKDVENMVNKQKAERGED